MPTSGSCPAPSRTWAVKRDWSGGLLTVLLAVLVARGSRRAWSVILALSVLTVALVILLAAVPWPPKLIGYLGLQAALIAILLTPSLRRYVH